MNSAAFPELYVMAAALAKELDRELGRTGEGELWDMLEACLEDALALAEAIRGLPARIG